MGLLHLPNGVIERGVSGVLSAPTQTWILQELFPVESHGTTLGVMVPKTTHHLPFHAQIAPTFPNSSLVLHGTKPFKCVCCCHYLSLPVRVGYALPFLWTPPQPPCLEHLQKRVGLGGWDSYSYRLRSLSYALMSLQQRINLKNRIKPVSHLIQKLKPEQLAETGLWGLEPRESPLGLNLLGLIRTPCDHTTQDQVLSRLAPLVCSLDNWCEWLRGRWVIRECLTVHGAPPKSQRFFFVEKQQC